MEHNTLQRRSAGTIKNMGVNSYSQIVSAFRAQGDLTDDQLAVFPVLQNALGVSRERHTAEIKRALYDEQLSEIAASLNSSSNTTKWEAEANYACPNVVHHPPTTKNVEIAEQILQTTPPTTIIQYPPAMTRTTTKLNRDLQKLVHDEVKHDGIINATQQPVNNTTKLNFNNFTNTDIQSSKVVRLVRAQQAPKRKTSLDTLIEVVQKELLRVNGQTNSMSPLKSPPHSRSLPSFKLQNRIAQSISSPHRPIISSVLPSSQTNHSFKLTRKRGLINLNSSKKVSLFPQRNRSLNHYYDDDYIENNEFDPSTEEIPSGPENIEEIVRETVDRLVAITLLNNAPFIVNMLTAVPGNGNNVNTDPSILTNTTSMVKSQSINSTNYLSSTGNELRTSPIKQQQIHHPQLIIQPTTTNPISTIQGNTTPTLFVAPRILNFQTVVPKPTTNIQIGNTKIILVSPSNINKHLPHSTAIPQQSNLANNSSVKLVKFTTTNNNNNTNPLPARSTALPTQASTLTLPKNVQIVIPSQTPSTIQLARTHTDDPNKTLPTTTNTFRPITGVTVDHIPQAAQEVTISTSPTSSPPLPTNTSDSQQQSALGTTVHVTTSNSSHQSAVDGNSQPLDFHGNTSKNKNYNTDTNVTNRGKARRRSSSSTPIDKPVGKILRPITKVLPATITDNTSPVPPIAQPQQQSVARTSPSQDEMTKSVSVNFQQQPSQLPRPPSTHGPMIYRMTSVNPNVPVFRVRATTAPTSATVMNKSIKTDAKPISVTTATNMCYEPKPTHPTPTPSGSVSVLACFKTTKKRNKERAIMPRPSTNDPNDSSIANTSSSTTNISLIANSDIINSNTSPDYQRQSSSTPTHFHQQTSLSSTLSDDTTSNLFPLSIPEQTNDTTTSSSNSIPIARDNQQLNSIETINTPPNLSPIQSAQSISRPEMEDKSIQCINEGADEEEENSTETNSDGKKRAGDEENWTTTAECLLRDVLSQPNFHLLDLNCQETLSSKFDLLRTNLLNGTFSSKDEFHQSILDLKQKFFADGLSLTFDENLDKIFHDFETEFSKLSDERKRIRRQ